ncbi:DUF721 domain-containing protein [Pseudoroseomonas ludipueritiae]|uniref:DUF721 domain-containing protein n=1 Tax=Pseudoroseomonas ludipueritiae TaxID=198093 RepID=A0ABR7R7S3_9PROT|nr:DUF721 domain-containing protein [Pseudoroseomonas ludipueritiae]MBC9177849.1 DUF721 domain-containing protein [Pseudoroseomonas ludipueritiae]
MKEEGQGGRGSSPARQNSAPEASLPGWRTDRGPRLLGAVMPQVTRPAFKKRSPAAAQLIAEWPSVVGPVLAAQTIPRGLTGGTLTIACSGPVAMELQHLAPQLIGKVNSAMGHALVQRLRFVQGVVPPPARRPPPLKPVALPETVSTALESVEDPQLREALARLAQGVYRGRRSPG